MTEQKMKIDFDMSLGIEDILNNPPESVIVGECNLNAEFEEKKRIATLVEQHPKEYLLKNNLLTRTQYKQGKKYLQQEKEQRQKEFEEMNAVAQLMHQCVGFEVGVNTKYKKSFWR